MLNFERIRNSSLFFFNIHCGEASMQQTISAYQVQIQKINQQQLLYRAK